MKKKNIYFNQAIHKVFSIYLASMATFFILKTILPVFIYILQSCYCNNVRLFSKTIKNTFFYFAAISVASSVEYIYIYIYIYIHTYIFG